MKAIIKEWILPLFLAGTGLVMPKDHLISNIIGYSLMLIAVYLFFVNLAKSRQWFLFSMRKHKSILSWHQGLDVMRHNNLSHHELLQFIKSGLSAYPEDTDIYHGTGKIEPLNSTKINFLTWNKSPLFEQEIEKLWFKKEDIKKHIKNIT
ncbi:MAG: hypothetical protein AB1512_32315 [Thermodesulfobacteriota bacterium]